MVLRTINPATNKIIKEYPEMSLDDIKDIIEKSQKAFFSWKNVNFNHRAEIMKKAARILQEDAESHARLMAQEMGKPLKTGIAESEKCAWVCKYYAENAEKFLQPEMIETDASKSFVTFQPLGVVLAVMPWNYPFYQVFRFLAPALMAGNAGVLKHASNVQGCALKIEEILCEAGFPENLFRTLLISKGLVDAVIEHPLIKAVTLTGSTPAGKAVAQKAGQMLKKTVVELGGSDPYVILEDADLDATVRTCVESRLLNSGQSCIAAKRFVVVDAIREQFVKRFVERLQAVKIGNPLDMDTEVGPLARTDLREILHRQVERSIEKGAQCLLGGVVPEGNGAYYPPTVLTDVSKGMPAYEEELFGPVAAIISAKDQAEAIIIANDTRFGLGAAVFTKDVVKGERIAAMELEAGSCFVNAFVKSDPRLPFGGIKESGYGRELSHHGIKEFVNIKTVYVNQSSSS
jgi:succinate-semialdehyde dehydrogenase/glutarate-semialdehyde dehydrogenase